MAPQRAEGRHDREEQSAHVRLCRQPVTSEGQLNSNPAPEATWSSVHGLRVEPAMTR